MPIREFFHLIHIVDDLAEADSWYRELFSPQFFMEQHWLDVEKRWASLFVVGDTVLEVIEPSSAPEDQHMPLTRFHNRFGRHFHSLAWYVDPEDIVPLYRRLRSHGVRVAKPGGGFFAEDEEPGNTIFTHPRETFGQIEFEGLNEHWRRVDPRFARGWSSAFWRDEHPLGIEGLSHLTTVVPDLAPAQALYEEALGGTTFHTETGRTAESAFVLVGGLTVVELARPVTDDSLLARDLAANGPLPHAATFKVRDLDSAERHVAKVGVRVAERGGDTLVLDPGDCRDAVYAFTDRILPGDPRRAASPPGLRPASATG